jgi:hypothetical protein
MPLFVDPNAEQAAVCCRAKPEHIAPGRDLSASSWSDTGIALSL